MKISYRNNPVMEKLKDGRLGFVGFYPEDSGIPECEPIIKEMRENFKTYAPYFKKHIRVITKPFSEAIFLARDKMIEDDLFKLDSCESGALFFPGGLTFLYIFWPFDLKNYGDHVFFVFHEGIFMGYSRQTMDVENGLFCVVSNRVVEDATPGFHAEGVTDKHTIINEIDSGFSTNIMATLNFIKYAPVETVSLNPHAKSKDILCKYVNDTDLPLQIFDSKWFTTFVKSDAFKVRGHFRLQPKKKDGEWTKELIWISDFMKEGYTAPARKLSHT